GWGAWVVATPPLPPWRGKGFQGWRLGARALEGEGAERAGLDGAVQGVAGERAGELERHRKRLGDGVRPGGGGAVDLAVGDRAGLALCALFAGQGAAIVLQAERRGL